MDQFITDMRIAKYSPATIQKRVEVLERLRRFLIDNRERELITATPDDLHAYQASYAHHEPATVDIYTRHIIAFYAWAAARGVVIPDPASGLIRTRVPRGKPHPTSFDDLRVILASTRGFLRLVYILAAFVGLRRGEICQLRGAEIYDLHGTTARALVHGKGGKERYVPLIAPVADELKLAPRRGYIVTQRGAPIPPPRLSVISHEHLYGLGFATTLHSMRHTFATEAVRITKDLLLVRDILGHESVATTQIYTESDMSNAHAQLGEFGMLARDLMHPSRHLRSVT